MCCRRQARKNCIPGTYGTVEKRVPPLFQNFGINLVLWHPWKSSMETVWKSAGTFKKYLAGDWMNHLSTTVLSCEAAGFTHRSHKNPRRTLIGCSDTSTQIKAWQKRFLHGVVISQIKLPRRVTHLLQRTYTLMLTIFQFLNVLGFCRWLDEPSVYRRLIL